MFHPKGPTLSELVQQALSSTERGYDLIAPKFDYTPFRTPDAIVEEIARRVGPVDAALDVCCGTGAALRALCKVVTKRVVGTDSSAGMLAEAAHHAGSAELVRGDALEMPFQPEFDAAVCVGAFGHIAVSDEPRFLHSIHRSLRPGGRFLFATSELPKLTTLARLAAEAFNAVMRVRNAVLSPPFIMYYLTFLWPEVRGRLLAAGFGDVEVVRGAFAAPYERALIVIARKAVD